MTDATNGYVPTTPPLRLRNKPTKSKKKLSRTTKEQRELLGLKYGPRNNQIDNHHDGKLEEVASDNQGLSYDTAATRIQYAWKLHYARSLKTQLQAQIGRPAQLQIHEISLSEKWLRLGAYCIVTVLRRPYGPLMYQYKTESTKEKKLHHEPFFVPIMSSKYDVIVTVISDPSRLQYPIFLGQSILHVDDKWANVGNLWVQEIPFRSYQFPVDIQLQNSERVLDGHVKLSLVSLNASISSFSGALLVKPTSVSKTLAAMRFRVGKFYMRNGMSYESSLSWCRQADARQWGVLTEKFLSVYSQGALFPHKNFDLRKIQLIHWEENQVSDIHGKPTHYQLKIYHEGAIHVFFVESRYEYHQWIYRIDSNRRKLLVP
ncbi:hypothetical protein Ae201684P_012072 [Aphanomyces euteiches]|uniref:PH domain-containing protein n=1 Tax=Aphanomyces euteiches TaxID=100861 RepID=A0A6G0WJ95_9STRA|nr:hypothetical protein Ae201684_014569 [Aphanomyces euteiches]KAH9081099.1 hypothetical protein Ae201684P_012072 [Aphanomyces euteiches]KAH9154385.1 hypothetical protein AeRB84_003516 [Aphanomyces euteiches]